MGEMIKKIIFCAMISVCFLHGVAGAETKNYFGHVVDCETDENLSFANIAVEGTTSGCATDTDGLFGKGDNICKLSDSNVKITYVGYKDKNVNLSDQNNEICLEPNFEILDGVDIVSSKINDGDECEISGIEHAAKGEYKRKNYKWICVLKECESGYVTSSDKSKCEGCVVPDNSNIESMTSQNNKCVVNKCISDEYMLSNDKTSCVKKDANGDIDTRTDEQKAADLKEKQDAYDVAKENEQSWENRLLTAGTTAATGFGGMELAQGLAEQKADEAAAADMAAHIATMRCTYGDGTSVRGGLTPVELPGGNNIEMMNLRAEYFALAESVKNRKESLGMAPGIESEVILDKSNMGLYDNENTGITGGTYSSLYRANLLNSESDQSQITSDKEKSDERVKYGTIAAVAGVGVGLVGNSLINGKLGDLFKNDKFNSQTRKLAEKEQDALADLKKCLKSAGVKNTDDLSFEKFYPSIVLVDNINCRHDLSGFKNKDASNLFADSTNEYTIYDTLNYYITTSTLKKMFGADRATRTSITNTIRESIESVKKKFQDALEQDKNSADKLGVVIGEVSDSDITNGLQYLQKLKTK